MQLRPYQRDAIEGIKRDFSAHNSTLIVEPTGCGKTVIFCSLIAETLPTGKRALILAHRSELVTQAAEKWEAISGEAAGIEMGVHRADGNWFARPRVVCSTIQTQIAGCGGDGRMTRFDPDEFGLVIIDEAHRATANSYRRILDYYGSNPSVRVLGVTATPDRRDREALGQVFKSVAHRYEILDAIHDGWLIRPEQEVVNVHGLDFGNVRTLGGDLHGGDLARAMESEQVIHRTVTPALEKARGRRGIFFTSSVAQAKLTAAIFNRHQPGSAASIDGMMDKEERRQVLADHKAGKLQWLVNVGVLTEGYDDDQIGIVVIGRPTKSRALYAQMVGRGTRPLKGTVDGLASSQDRLASIAASDKPVVTVIDFTDSSKRHKLINTADILGGKYTLEAIERVKAQLAAKGSGGGGGAGGGGGGNGGSSPVDVISALDAAAAEEKAEQEAKARRLKEAREEAQRRALVAKANYTTERVDPFNDPPFEPTGQIPTGTRKQAKYREPVTKKQLEFLSKHGIDAKGLSKAEAGRKVSQILGGHKGVTCSPKQAQILSRFGYDPDQYTKAQASKIIDEIALNGWRRPGSNRTAMRY